MFFGSYLYDQLSFKNLTCYTATMLKVAIVHDFLLRLGGAERVLAALAELYKNAPIYTLLYDEKTTWKEFPHERIRPSGLQKLPRFIRNNHRYLIGMMPRALEAWDFSEYDLVISSNTALSHGIVTPSHTMHISYIHSPMRFAWDWTHEYLKNESLLKRAAGALLLKKLRLWDQYASDRPDHLIANSRNIQRRIHKYYRRDAAVVYPPVDIERFSPAKRRENYFVMISNLTPYKRVDLAIYLFNKIGRRLVIIGDGPQRDFLKSIAGPNIEFQGFLSDTESAAILSKAQALIFPGEEDFGIVPVEAMACGVPVLALRRGGVQESVIEGVTGEFFDEANVASMEAGLARLILNLKKYDRNVIRARAEEFSKANFLSRMRYVIRQMRSQAKLH
ncbi:glycosyl transferase [Candidatus Peregrinibacteria bacterium CG11_big_fil_rev_8_21_14_0_20_46_8]|nr:MAG: glycosyl transferase [Candidatus Peregrinibacteria bacterium CG11_big_fil_rev_8_21_14_0_20_46_8]